MIKPDSTQMQSIRSDDELDVPAERRAELAVKGQRLYGKFCGTRGTGICAESFAEYHIWRGELIVARDLLVYLHRQAGQLTDPTRLAMTRELITRIEALLGESVEAVPAP